MHVHAIPSMKLKFLFSITLQARVVSQKIQPLVSSLLRLEANGVRETHRLPKVQIVHFQHKTLRNIASLENIFWY